MNNLIAPCVYRAQMFNICVPKQVIGLAIFPSDELFKNGVSSLRVGDLEKDHSTSGRIYAT